MSKAICAVDDCPDGAVTRGWCVKHYTRWKRHGSPTTVVLNARSGCVVDGCDGSHHAHGWCNNHYRLWLRYGDPLGPPPRPKTPPTPKTPGPNRTAVKKGQRGEAHPGWKGVHIGYDAAHLRTKRLRGSASLHACVDCRSPATDWSYNHHADIEIIDEFGRRYSASPADYEPRCRLCHKTFDAA